MPISIGTRRPVLMNRALVLAIVTVVYNLAEGGISVYFGGRDETVALFGFGLDSFVEVISGLGILHMVLRMRRGGPEDTDRFESSALRVTGGAFYLLAAGLFVTAGIDVYAGHAPETTFWGVVVGAVSIATMWALIRLKMDVGRGLGSTAIIADAACTRACLYLSVVLLASSAVYELTGFGLVDSAGAAVIGWFALREGREAFEKAAGKSCGCGGGACGK